MFIRESKETGEKELMDAKEFQFRIMGAVKNSALAVQQAVEGAKFQDSFNFYYYDFNAI